MLKQITSSETVHRDLVWIQKACDESYTGLGVVEILRSVDERTRQLWRWGNSKGVVITEVHEYPKGRELFVFAMAGVGFFEKADELCGMLMAYGYHMECRWLLGVTCHKGVERMFNKCFNETTEYAMLQMNLPDIAERATGLRGDVAVKTPSGPKMVRDLVVGDEVMGEDEPQKITWIGTQLVEEITAKGLGAEHQIWNGTGWQDAADISPISHTLPTLVFELTVEPDHSFQLENGLLVHNKGGGTNTNTIKEADPWKPAQPYLKRLMAQSEKAFKESQAAGKENNPSQDAIYQKRQDIAQGADAGADILKENALASLRGDYLDPDSNPWFQSAVDAAIRPAKESYNQVVLPGIEDKAIASGAFGGSRHGVADAIASKNLEQQILDTTSQMAYQNYANERQLQLTAPNRLLQSTAMELKPTDIMQQIVNQKQQMPFVPVNQYANVLNTIAGKGGSSSASSDGGPSQFAQTATGALGGGATGAMVGAKIGSGYPGIGTLIGAGIGGLAGYLGS